MAILKLKFLKMSKGGSFIWSGAPMVTAKIDGKPETFQSGQGMRVYATIGGAEMEVDDKKLIPMEIDGVAKANHYWL